MLETAFIIALFILVGLMLGLFIWREIYWSRAMRDMAELFNHERSLLMDRLMARTFVEYKVYEKPEEFVNQSQPEPSPEDVMFASLGT